MSDTFPNSVTHHGTVSGWTKHRAMGERPCDSCRAARQEYDAPRRPSKRADRRALQRLADMYPDAYAALYAEERALAEEPS